MNPVFTITAKVSFVLIVKLEHFEHAVNIDIVDVY